MRAFSIAAIGLLSLALQVHAAEHTADSLADVQKKVAEKKAILVDVREASEWKAGHIAGAEFLPISEISKRSKDPEFQRELAKRLERDDNKIVYLHCKAGGRCLLAADALKRLGYDARPLKSGYDDLLKAGFEKAADDPPAR